LDFKPARPRGPAAPEEVRSAYRRSAKLYHPDHDSSPEGEARYQEIRAFYEALHRRNNTSMKDDRAFNPKRNQKRNYSTASDNDDSGEFYGTSGASGWRVYRERGLFKNSVMDDLLGMNDSPLPEPRVPFSGENLFSILRQSIKESVGLGLALRTCVCVRILWSIFRDLPLLQASKIFFIFFVTCLLMGCLVFRYYGVGSVNRKSFFAVSSLGCALSLSLIVVFLNFWENPKIDFGNMFWSVFLKTLLSLIVLWLKPFT
jgi:hypothetical protein